MSPTVERLGSRFYKVQNWTFSISEGCDNTYWVTYWDLYATPIGEERRIAFSYCPTPEEAAERILNNVNIMGGQDEHTVQNWTSCISEECDDSYWTTYWDVHFMGGQDEHTG